MTNDEMLRAAEDYATFTADGCVFVTSGELLSAFLAGVQWQMRRQLRNDLLMLGWIDRGDVLVRYTNPRLGWKPADGTLIIGYNEHPEKVNSISKLYSILCGN